MSLDNFLFLKDYSPTLAAIICHLASALCRPSSRLRQGTTVGRLPSAFRRLSSDFRIALRGARVYFFVIHGPWAYNDGLRNTVYEHDDYGKNPGAGGG